MTELLSSSSLCLYYSLNASSVSQRLFITCCICFEMFSAPKGVSSEGKEVILDKQSLISLSTCSWVILPMNLRMVLHKKSLFATSMRWYLLLMSFTRSDFYLDALLRSLCSLKDFSLRNSFRSMSLCLFLACRSFFSFS